eukprot:CAMPEP_0174891300 /NCGR_PEP_ID=MMETSP0167-20121228/6367_1 /TAXON_ID=38298 /ORGANISM="Rhodella maculata, Strain CCMP736" /LENGTH=78 /DNA_ID=CAMNT_0016129403 /DNA_START=53 /DNA_END=286 /DNA_ORIENTATION=+
MAPTPCPRGSPRRRGSFASPKAGLPRRRGAPALPRLPSVAAAPPQRRGSPASARLPGSLPSCAITGGMIFPLKHGQRF